ncbi:hypothetical protein [Pseudonocardia xinjiangensis]|uniref:Uncharacterized protein n=1 Tax=Pseudonocardia xinjiangensis TaxID=75289 RepID=A0ABX1R8E3_9PSEU|nr:hypothetical protein [Pseudonocardia xinjiangensis]NMH75724.1 hypothetical protein [Pseudonocardia xinjiangensis]
MINGEENGAGGADPWHIVDVETLDVDTVTLVIRQVEISPRADQLAYRESEIDALWTLADMAAQAGDTDASEWLELLWQAHDHVGDGDRTQALAALTRLRDRIAEADRRRSPHSAST